MKEIKFRAVYKNDIALGNGKLEPGLIFYQKQIGDRLYFVMESDDDFRYPLDVVLLDDDWIKMQFIGLCDIDGNEIYNGDIVNCFPNGCPHVVEWFDDNGGTYGGGMPGVNLNGLYRNCGTGYAWTGKEKRIGNIYENPELLEVSP